MNAADEYLAARVMTAPPQALHLIVVDGALRHCTRAEAALETGDGPAAAKSLEQARAFVSELIRGLDKNAAPEIVGNVASLFVFVYRRIAEAELFLSADPPRSADKVRDAAKVLRMHRETWAELLSRLNSAPATAVETPPPAVEPPAPVPAPHAARRIPTGYDDYQPRSWTG